MASKIRMSKDHDLIDCKPVLWTKLTNGMICGVCGHTNKVFNIEHTPIAMAIRQDILIGKTGCVEEGCEESHNCLNYHCEYCEASNIKEAYVNMCKSQNWMSKREIERLFDDENWECVELILEAIENKLRNANCLPVKEHCYVDWWGVV